MLLKVLLKQMTVAEAKAEWKRIEKKKSQDDTRTDGPWLLSMEIPCRRCTDRNEGIEVKKPLAMFLAIGKKTPSDIWNDTLHKGQDLCCSNCLYEMNAETRRAPIVGCDGCGEVLLRKKFGDEMLKDWSASLIKEVYCKDCNGENSQKRSEADCLQCYGLCKTTWPEHHFDSATLVACAADDSVMSRHCARCVATAKDIASKETHGCARCRAWKPIADFGPVACKEWLSGKRTGGKGSFRWVCFDCGYPQCVL